MYIGPFGSRGLVKRFWRCRGLPQTSVSPMRRSASRSIAAKLLCSWINGRCFQLLHHMGASRPVFPFFRYWFLPFALSWILFSIPPPILTLSQLEVGPNRPAAVRSSTALASDAASETHGGPGETGNQMDNIKTESS